jgi:asparagine synthase (glutamine-hydrolysing)
LFITQTRERYAFATEYKALLALEDVAARPNRDAIQHLQATKQLFPGGSLLEGIRPLKPGSCLELGGPVPVEHCYRPLALRVQRGTRATHAASLQESLLQAARRQTQDHPELGIALSAGLDSAVVVGAVKHVAPHSRLHTFTAGHSTGDPDLAAAAAVAREFDTDHHEVLLAPDDLPQLLPQVVWHIEDPIGREEMVFWYLIAQQAARYVPTLLCGNLADLLFGGMPRFKVVHAAAHFRWLGPALEEFYNCTQTGHRPASACARLFTQAYYRKMPTSVPTVRDAHAALEYTRFDLKSNDPLNALLVAGLQGQPNPNATCERLYGSAGLTYNSPFYDLDVVDCAFRIPGALKIRGLQQKHILRRAARAFVPRHILERPKGLLRLARNERLSQVLSEMAEQYLNDRAVAERGLFDVQQIRRLREPSNGVYSEDQLYRVWTLLLTEMWAIRFLDHRGARHADEGMQESQIEAIKAMPR